VGDAYLRPAEARRRAGAVKRGFAVAGAAGFLAVLGLARLTHPGHAATHAGSATGTASARSVSAGGFGFGSASVSPSSGSSSVQSSGS
jgi:hypothetical protein